MITFVTFHIDPAEESLPADTPYDLAKRAKRSDEYRWMIALMFQSVSVFHPDARKVVLTDRQAQFANLPDSVEIYRHDVDANNVMLSRTEAQLAFIKTHDFKSNVMFLDNDILINDSLDRLSWSDFDVALTIREDPLGMPVNGGALFLSNRRPEVVIEFLQAFYQRYIDKYSDEAQWWGDQKALVDLLDEEESPIVVGKRNVGEAVVQLVACDTYNYSPNHFKADLDLYGSGVGRSVMHFKGDRKQYMQAFWDSCLQPRLQPTAQFNLFQQQLDSLQQDRQQLQKALRTEQKAHRTAQKKYCALEKKTTALEQRYNNLVKHPVRSGLKALTRAFKKQIQS